METDKEQGAWVCNECGSHEYTGSVSESDARWMGCANCGSDEFHWEEPVRAAAALAKERE